MRPHGSARSTGLATGLHGRKTALRVEGLFSNPKYIFRPAEGSSSRSGDTGTFDMPGSCSACATRLQVPSMMRAGTRIIAGSKFHQPITLAREVVAPQRMGIAVIAAIVDHHLVDSIDVGRAPRGLTTSTLSPTATPTSSPVSVCAPPGYRER